MAKPKIIGKLEGKTVWEVPSLPLEDPESGGPIDYVELEHIILLSPQGSQEYQEFLRSQRAPDVPKSLLKG